MKTHLTDSPVPSTIRPAGQTDAGAAGGQPARDTRPERRNSVGGGDLLHPYHSRLFLSSLYLKKLPAGGRSYHLTGKALCPIPAEPIHTAHDLRLGYLYIESFHDPGVTEAATELENLCGGPAGKIRQKIVTSSRRPTASSRVAVRPALHTLHFTLCTSRLYAPAARP